MASTAWMIRKGLNWVRAHYGDVPVYLQTGYLTEPGVINDTDRIVIIRAFANEALKGLL